MMASRTSQAGDDLQPLDGGADDGFGNADDGGFGNDDLGADDGFGDLSRR